MFLLDQYIHFLNHGRGGKREFLRNYFARLADGDDPFAALADMEWSAMEGHWRAHVKEVGK